MIGTEKFNKIILVEGKDDLHVLYALCEKYTIPETFDLVDCEGIENLISQIPVRLRLGVESLGIIVDADTNLDGRRTSIKNILIQFGFSVPPQFPEEGISKTTNGNINVSIWIMPNNKVKGMLEDFLEFLIPVGDKLLPIAESTLNEIETKSLNRYKETYKSKALLHTWLAWQEDPGTPFGQAITKRYLIKEGTEVKDFISWLKEFAAKE